MCFHFSESVIWGGRTKKRVAVLDKNRREKQKKHVRARSEKTTAEAELKLEGIIGMSVRWDTQESGH